MDKVVVNAMRRVEELRSELAELQSFLRLYRRLGGDVGDPGLAIENGSRPDPRRQDDSVSTSVDDATTPNDEVATSPGVIAERAIDILRASGHDMEREELVDAIEGGGLRIASKDKAGYLLVLMNRNVKGQYRFEGRRLRFVGKVGHEAAGRDRRAVEAQPET